jgi:hypothetical protein
VLSRCALIAAIRSSFDRPLTLVTPASVASASSAGFESCPQVGIVLQGLLRFRSRIFDGGLATLDLLHPRRRRGRWRGTISPSSTSTPAPSALSGTA